MKENSFTFMSGSSKKENPEQQIKLLRQEALKIRDANNKVTQEITDIDFKLAKPMDNESKNSLEERKKHLQSIIDTEGYSQKYQDKLEQIKQLEMEHFGHSDLNNSTFDL